MNEKALKTTRHDFQQLKGIFHALMNKSLKSIKVTQRFFPSILNQRIYIEIDRPERLFRKKSLLIFAN
jgi:hypothetical protein